ncbi:hypothetical protein TRFO_03653 [Tritrichomonas foetus]|uniref:Chorein N-terminal domain-containing protein n=1 Tax=Tritrichomonas foetus TaxID=1144522 RepID=A0A1J4KMS6_9EUKA|nr:hypothetical protein TRFO_03653 [Tritrichomonas foetus]|eukprot:OHT12617.1 hypothetical protein TRFO_03653 [Tritrichomonas foetus]
MLESIVSKLLMRYLKEYIESINSSQMEMALWKGQAKFTNLSFRPTALINHMIPFRIVKGLISSVQLDFPWKHLDTEPCVIKVTDIFVILSPEKDVLIKRDLQLKQLIMKSKKDDSDDFSLEDEEDMWQSLVDSIFDNARLDIERIHIRLEIPGEFNTFAFGLIIPSITVRTVDADKNEIKSVPGELVTRKRLLVKDIAFYFDTLSDPVEIEDFPYVMREEMKKNHQFILEPFTIDLVLTHSRDKSNPLKNQIDILIKKLTLSLDYLQSRAIMNINKEWTMLQKQRNFSHCMRPPVFENTAQLWEYSFRCAVTVMRPYDFKPDLAIKILKNRKSYLNQIRKTQKVSSISMYQSYKYKKLKKIEDTIGLEATFFLREYCDAVLAKEQRNYDNNLTPFEISDIREIHQSKGDFFSKNAFSVCFGLSTFEILLNFSKGTPLIQILFENISTGLSCVQANDSSFFKIHSITMKSYANENAHTVFSVSNNLPQFISFESQTTGEKAITYDVIHIDSFIFRPDYKTINTAVDFFIEDRDEASKKSPRVLDNTPKRVFRVDAFDVLKSLLSMRNHNIIVNSDVFSIIYPFTHGETTDELKLTINKVEFTKIATVYYPQFSSMTKMNMSLNVEIGKLTFSNATIISDFTFASQLMMGFSRHDLSLEANITITPISIHFDNFPFDALKSFMASVKLISFLVATDTNEFKKIISFRKVKTDLTTQIKSISLIIKEKSINTSLAINDVDVTAEFFRGLSQTQICFSSLNVTDNEKQLIKIDEKFTLTLTQVIEDEPLMLTLNVIDPYMNGDIQWVKNFIEVVLLYLDVFNVQPDSLMSSNSSDSKPLHLNLIISNPLIYISHDEKTPYLQMFTAHIYDDENFKILIDIDEFSIMREKYFVVQPVNISLSVETQDDIVVRMDLPKFHMRASQVEYTYILPFISHLLEVLPINNNNSSQKAIVDMSVEGLDLLVCDNDQDFVECSIKKTKIDVISEDDSTSVELSTEGANIYQLYGENVKKSLLDFCNFALKYKSGGDIDNVILDIPSGSVGLSDKFLGLVPFFTEFEYPPYPLPRKDSLIQVSIGMKPISVSLFNENSTIIELHLGESKFDILANTENPEKTELSIEIENIFGNTSFFDEKVLAIEKTITILIKKQIFKCSINTISLILSMPLMLNLVDFMQLFQNCETEGESEGIPFDFDVSIGLIELNALTLMTRGPHCIGSILKPEFVLNNSMNLASFSVESIEMSSGYNNLSMKKFLDIDNISGILEFNSNVNNKFTSFDDVAKLSHQEFKPTPISSVLINIFLKNISLNYTHQMAMAIIGCFIPPSQHLTKSNEALLAIKNETHVSEISKKIPKSDSQTPKLKLSISAESFCLIFSIITPIAYFKVQQFSANFDEEWEVIVKTAIIEPSYDHVKLKIPLFNCPPDQDLIRLNMKRNEMFLTFIQSDLFFDYTFWVPLISFITQSPFLHIQSIMEGKENATKEQVSIPIKLNLKADKFHIILPVSLNYEKCQMLHINMGYTASYVDNFLNASINNLNVHVSDQIKNVDFSPIIDGLSLVLEDANFDKNKIQLHAIISPIKIVLSAFDFVLIGKIAKSFNESIGSLVVSADTHSESSPTSLLADVHLEIGKMKILIVKDNRSSSRFTPIFKVKNTPINLKVNSIDDLIIGLSLSPYISYFNESTGRWDLIIEPLTMNLDVALSKNALGLSTKSTQSININLPTTAIAQYLDLWKEIRSNITQKVIAFENLPQLWFQNNLGSDVKVIYKEKAQKHKEIIVKRLETIGINEFKPNSKIVIDCEGHIETIRTRFLNYPTMYSKSFSVVRKSYKGGILIQFNPPVQFLNTLSIDLDLYLKNGDEYTKIDTVKSGQRYPLTFTDGKSKEFSFTDPQFKDMSSNLIAKISPYDTSNITVTVYKDRKIRCVICIEFESSVSKVFKLIPYVIGVNLLPFSLYAKQTDGNIVHIEANNTSEMLFVDSSTNQFEAALSIKENEFPEISTFKIKKTANNIDVYPEETIALRSETVDDQLMIIFYVPCVFFNTFTDKEIIIKESITKNPIEKSIKAGKCLLWCPPSYISDNDQLSAYISVPNSQSNLVNCAEFQRGTLYLQSNKVTELFDGIRFRIVKRNNISVATFSPLLIIRNELNMKITLQPLECVPKNFQDDILTVGCPTTIQSGSECNMELISQVGSFLVWIDGFKNSPALSLLEQRKIVFKMHSNDSHELMEVEITDVDTSFIAVFRRSSFPTPIVIANQLENSTVQAYQKVKESPFIIGPESTSMFAFDEPLGYPNTYLIINDMKFNISLIEDTDQILLEQTAMTTPIYVKIKQNISGVKMVYISSEKEEPPTGFEFNVHCEIPEIFISVIDLQMREFCLLTLGNIKIRLDILPSGVAFQFELGEFQIDDQNALAPNPVFLHGRHSNDTPFVKIDALLTSDTKPMTSFKYISLLMQRIDVQLDSSFVSDAINMTMKIAKPIRLPIQPLQPKESLVSSEIIVTYNWLEVSPIYLLFKYNNLTGRPTNVAPMLYPMRFIPTIASTKVMFPGIVVAHITDRVDFIIDKVSNDYKTAALEQVLESLGTSGKILTTFGITATIAEKLDITLKSELTDSIQNFQSITAEDFDNRREINGCFSQQTLSTLQTKIDENKLQASTVINNIADQKDVAGLMIRDFPGSGFGHGIVGVLKKATIDTMEDIKVMSGVERKRVPRAFPDNKIEKFNKEICTIQNTIQTNGKTFEKIQMKTQNEETGEYTVITEVAIYFLVPPFDKIRQKIKIKEIKLIKADSHKIYIEYTILKKEELITCANEYEAECFLKYLESQRIYSDLFTKSIV